ncbi:MAG: copper transporter [Armatimonadetes bacterium]|nr:copper transporter [Armatimonadota bacterium]MDE2206940.1 copper transporter [Armatimonadota bacterium]
MITVSAIFFALAVGLLIGGLYGSPTVTARQANAISDLGRTLTQQTTQLEPYKTYATRVSPVFLVNKLTGYRIAVVITGDYPDTGASVADTLEQAGATVTGVMTLGTRASGDDSDVARRLATISRAGSQAPASRQELVTALANIVAHGDNPERALLPSLVSVGMVTTHADTDFSIGCHDAVIVGGGREADAGRIDEIDAPLVRGLQNSGITVTMAEPESATVSDVAAYHAAGLQLATVDDVDTVIGQTSLVLSFKRDPDDFGVKPTAHQLMPDPAAP